MNTEQRILFKLNKFNNNNIRFNDLKNELVNTLDFYTGRELERRLQIIEEKLDKILKLCYKYLSD